MLEIVHKPFSLELYGYSGTAVDQCYGDTGSRLMDRLWKTVKSNKLKNRGINVWVYEPNEAMFTGVELESPAAPGIELERKVISLSNYAYFRHLGPYSQLKEVYSSMREELKHRNITMGYPGLEIYGHWSNDETKLETEILIAVS